MRPLQSIAMGLVIVGLRANLIGEYDALPDPLGWVLVILGVHGLPAELPRRDTVVTLAWLAGLVSVPLWFPGVSDAAFATHPSLAWALTLPQLGFAAVLCHSLAASAAEAEDHKSASWLRLAMTGFVVAAVLPVIVFGAGAGSLELTADVGAAVILLALIWLLFSYSTRPWAVDQPVDGPVD